MPTVVFQVVSQDNFLSKFNDPAFWKVYKLYVLREITEKAMEAVSTYAATLWAHPTGALDQSWIARVDPEKELGFISNSKPYAYWLNYGVRPHKMVYLLNRADEDVFYLKDGSKAVVVPIRSRAKGGGTLFRIATSKQMLDHPTTKPWFHKGIEPKQFLEKGMEQYAADKAQLDFEGLNIEILNL